MFYIDLDGSFRYGTSGELTECVNVIEFLSTPVGNKLVYYDMFVNAKVACRVMVYISYLNGDDFDR